jgi:hypothetical protein
MKTLTVVGTRWFHRGPGNTYHSVAIVADGVCHTSARIYGYGDQYMWTAFVMLERLGLVTDRERYANGLSESLSRYCERKGIKLTTFVFDVPRRRDLLVGNLEAE